EEGDEWVRLKADTTYALVIDGELIGRAITKCIAAPRVRRLRNLGEQIVHERQQLRGGAEACRNRLPRLSLGAQRADELGGLVEDGHFGVAEAVDRLLA